MTAAGQRFAVYHRSPAAKPRRWKLIDVFLTHEAARQAAFSLGSGDIWVTAIEANPAADTAPTPAEQRNFKLRHHQPVRAST